MKKNKIIINKIEIIRSKNNKNWMDLLRLAFKYAPKEAKKILKKINQHDKKISNLFNEISKI
jgi:hypothetical protein